MQQQHKWKIVAGIMCMWVLLGTAGWVVSVLDLWLKLLPANASFIFSFILSVIVIVRGGEVVVVEAIKLVREVREEKLTRPTK